MRVSVQASLSWLSFYEQTLCLHMGCIISTSTLWESSAINAAVLCCDKPPLSACIYISYQLSGCNNSTGHHHTCIRGKPSRATIKKKNLTMFQLGNYLHSILWQSFYENLRVIVFNTVVKKYGVLLHQRHVEINCTHQKTCRSHTPKWLLAWAAGRSS